LARNAYMREWNKTHSGNIVGPKFETWLAPAA